MKTISILLASVGLFCFSVMAIAQTAPKPKAKTTTSSQPRTSRKAASKDLAVIKDTAAFRRSSRPDAMPLRVRPTSIKK